MLTVALSQGWGVITDPLEVVPLDDTRIHQRGLSCWCGAFLDEDLIIVHEANDGRQYFERGWRKTC